jgi:glucose/arabinose dehydrogenase
MTPLDTGDLILSQPRGGLVVLLFADRDGDGRSDGRKTLFANLDRPNGVDLHDGWLYVAEATRVSRVRFDAAARAVRGELQPLVTGLTADGAHWRKTARIGPDGLLYLGQGSTCNVCIEADPRRATVMRFAATGGAGEIIATGTRNPYGFDWAPWDGALYATENSRDLLGDDTPPDELNRIVRGGFYGWPYVHGRDVVDPEYGVGNAAVIARATRRSASVSCAMHRGPPVSSARRWWRCMVPGTAARPMATRWSRCTSAQTGASRSGRSSMAFAVPTD